MIVGRQRFRTITERPHGAGVITVDGASGVSEIVFAEPTDVTVLGLWRQKVCGSRLTRRVARYREKMYFWPIDLLLLQKLENF